MLVWRGWGIGVVLIAVIVNVLMQSLLGMAMGDHDYGKSHGWTWVLSMGIAAVCIWFVGVRLEARGGRTVIDKDSGQEFELKAKHDLFWVPFKYWAFVLLALGVVFAFGGR